MTSQIESLLDLSSVDEEAVMTTATGRYRPRNHGGKMSSIVDRARENASALGDVPSQLAALETMNVAALAERYRELYGEPTHSRNKVYLQKRLAWRIQELAEGGLSQGAVARIRQIGDRLPERWRVRQAQVAAAAQPAREPTPALPEPAPRDPRLPPVGTVLRRVFEGTTHAVTVCAEGFEYAGRQYTSLSAIATQIAGTRWNGYLFFGLKKRDLPREGSVA